MPAAVPDRALHAAREDLMLGLGRREGSEVVLAEQQVGRLGEPLLVERPRVPPAAVRLEGRGRPAPEDAVAVAASPGRVAGVEAGVDGLYLGDRYVARELGVQRFGSAFGRGPAIGVDARDLRERMNARVGPAGHGETVPTREDGLERLPQRPFDRPHPRLGGPAPEARAVVLER